MNKMKGKVRLIERNENENVTLYVNVEVNVLGMIMKIGGLYWNAPLVVHLVIPFLSGLGSYLLAMEKAMTARVFNPNTWEITMFNDH